MVLRLLVALFAFLVAPVSLASQQPATSTGIANAQDRLARVSARVQALLDSIRTAGRFPGATFSAALADGSVIAVASGMSDTALKLTMKASDRMPQGSVGKTYVSALAMQLVQEGKLDLAAPISRYLGGEQWFSRLPNAQSITVRNLLNHTSGLVRYEFNPRFTADLSRAPADKVWTPVELITYMFDAPPPFAPGASWEYSDTNYMVLGLIIEKLLGRPMIAEIQARFVVPMRLSETVPNLSRRVAGVVQGYAGPANPFGGTDAMLTNGQFAFNPQFEWAGGGWSSTASDLARWGRQLYEWKAFDAAISAEFLLGVASRLGANVTYGLGVIIFPPPANAAALGQAYGHSGFFPGYQTELRYYPVHKFASALQINSSNGRVMPQGMSMSSAIALLSAVVAELR